MEVLNTYFDTLVFYYAEEKQGHALYVASVAGMLGGDKMRCIIAFVPAHLGIVTKARLRDLPWKNLQMRTIPKSTYKINTQAWKAPISGSAIPDILLKVVNRDKNYTTCVNVTEGVNFPFDVLMIHSPKKNTVYQFPNTMNLHWAIDQFSTVFNLQHVELQYINTNTNNTNTNTNTNVQNGNVEWI